MSDVTRHELRQYVADYHDPKWGTRGRFQVKALTRESADVQARDGYFGLLAPPSDERRAQLEVELTDLGPVPDTDRGA
jgi:hypothetical protein